ncbi:hypothetical protein BIV57_13690 [Mangrovactinospora gilvigrisea]|uniref:UspA domain-containing protein n=2 Tax=Mangrovactinospora gilvigrisea TaxID=1428644 RepID=A0A1J7BE16_9ACTN|nr:hypothetical protein BIV57_13690 [Mangrovactinospora gilvigrisea]
MYGTILAALDTTPEGDRVLEQAAGLAKATGARVRVLHVRAADVTIGAAVEEEEESASKEFLDGAVARLRDQGVDADGELAESIRPLLPQAVMDAVEGAGADLLVLGRRRHGAVASLIVGSVADGVAHRTDVPVLLVP